MRRVGASSASSRNKRSLFEEQLAKRAREKDEQRVKEKDEQRAEGQTKRQRVEVESAITETDHDAVDERVEMEEVDDGQDVYFCIKGGEGAVEEEGEEQESEAQGGSRGNTKKPNGLDGMEQFLNRSGVVASRPNTVCAQQQGGG